MLPDVLTSAVARVLTALNKAADKQGAAFWARQDEPNAEQRTASASPYVSVSERAITAPYRESSVAARTGSQTRRTLASASETALNLLVRHL